MSMTEDLLQNLRDAIEAYGDRMGEVAAATDLALEALKTLNDAVFALQNANITITRPAAAK